MGEVKVEAEAEIERLADHRISMSGGGEGTWSADTEELERMVVVPTPLSPFDPTPGQWGGCRNSFRINCCRDRSHQGGEEEEEQ